MSARMPRGAVAVALLTALLTLAALPQAGLAAITIDTSGHNGAWSVIDSATAAALRCTYDDDHNLSHLTVTPPVMNATTKRSRLVGWQLQVLRAEWWAKVPDQWYVAYSSPIVRQSSTKTRSAVFGDETWAVPGSFQTNYDSLKVRLVLYWYGSNEKKVIGHTTVELEYYGLEQAGQPFDPATSTFAGHCLGSQNTPQPPPVDPVASVPAGFVKMSHWQPYWQKFSTAKVQSTIDQLTAMHQTGVVLTGIESGDKYALPANVATYLQMFRDAGITPYMSLWIGKFSPAETSTTVRAWQAGNGLWGGIVLDVEGGLLATVAKGRSAAVAALDQYMGTVRPLTPFLAFSTMPIPTDFPDMLYSELNSYADVFMPQLYFRGGKTALYLFDRLKAGIDYASATWAEPVKPIIPVVDDWDPNLDVDQLNSYIQIALSRYGAVSAWRLHPEMQQAVKDLWGTFPQ